jgi:hypothetical protein
VTVAFEIGDATRYAPVDLVFGLVVASGTITASTAAGEHPSIGSSVIDPAQDVNRWWSLGNGGTVFNTLDVTFTFNLADVDAGAQTAAFVVGKWDGSWTLPPSAGQSPTSITAAGMTSLSDFAVGEVAATLPDAAFSIRTTGGMGAIPLIASAWTLLLLTLAVFSVRGVCARSARTQPPRSWARVASRRLSRLEIGRLPVQGRVQSALLIGLVDFDRREPVDQPQHAVGEAEGPDR